MNTDEWIDVLVQSVGFNPEMFGKRSMLTQLIRLIPFCEHNYNLIELGPKGTGKSHIYSEFSPHGILISGGEVTVPKLFVNNSSGKSGWLATGIVLPLTNLPASKSEWTRPWLIS
jgi:ATP-dependent Lon protease